MAQVWFWLVIMVAAFVALIAAITYVQSGGAAEFAREMAGPPSEKSKGDAAEDAPAEAADAA